MLEARCVESLCSKQLGGSLRTDVVMLLSDFMEDNNRLVPGRFGYSLDRVGYGSGKLVFLLTPATMHQNLDNWHSFNRRRASGPVEESYRPAISLQGLKYLPMS